MWLAVPSIATTPTDPITYDIDGIWDTTRSTNWQKVLIGNSASFTNMQGTLSGGDKNTQFLVAGGFSNQGTVYPGDYSDKKSSGHFGITHSSDDLRFRLQAGVSYTNDNNILTSADITSSILLAPDAPALFNANGSVNWEFYNGAYTFGNPLAEALIHSKAVTNNLISNMSLSYEVFPGLQIKSQFGYNYDEIEPNHYHPVNRYCSAE